MGSVKATLLKDLVKEGFVLPQNPQFSLPVITDNLSKVHYDSTCNLLAAPATRTEMSLADLTSAKYCRCTTQKHYWVDRRPVDRSLYLTALSAVHDSLSLQRKINTHITKGPPSLSYISKQAADIAALRKRIRSLIATPNSADTLQELHNILQFQYKLLDDTAKTLADLPPDKALWLKYVEQAQQKYLSGHKATEPLSAHGLIILATDLTSLNSEHALSLLRKAAIAKSSSRIVVLLPAWAYNSFILELGTNFPTVSAASSLRALPNPTPGSLEELFTHFEKSLTAWCRNLTSLDQALSNPEKYDHIQLNKQTTGVENSRLNRKDSTLLGNSLGEL